MRAHLNHIEAGFKPPPGSGLRTGSQTGLGTGLNATCKDGFGCILLVGTICFEIDFVLAKRVR